MILDAKLMAKLPPSIACRFAAVEIVIAAWRDVADGLRRVNALRLPPGIVRDVLTRAVFRSASQKVAWQRRRLAGRSRKDDTS